MNQSRFADHPSFYEGASFMAKRVVTQVVGDCANATVPAGEFD